LEIHVHCTRFAFKASTIAIYLHDTTTLAKCLKHDEISEIAIRYRMGVKRLHQAVVLNVKLCNILQSTFSYSVEDAYSSNPQSTDYFTSMAAI